MGMMNVGNIGCRFIEQPTEKWHSGDDKQSKSVAQFRVRGIPVALTDEASMSRIHLERFYKLKPSNVAMYYVLVDMSDYRIG